MNTRIIDIDPVEELLKANVIVGTLSPTEADRLLELYHRMRSKAMEDKEPTTLYRHTVGPDGHIDWRARAIAHAQALSSMLAVPRPQSGTFGEQWQAEAKETCNLYNKERYEESTRQRG